MDTECRTRSSRSDSCTNTSPRADEPLHSEQSIDSLAHACSQLLLDPAYSRGVARVRDDELADDGDHVHDDEDDDQELHHVRLHREPEPQPRGTHAWRVLIVSSMQFLEFRLDLRAWGRGLCTTATRTTSCRAAIGSHSGLHARPGVPRRTHPRPHGRRSWSSCSRCEGFSPAGSRPAAPLPGGVREQNAGACLQVRRNAIRNTPRGVDLEPNGCSDVEGQLLARFPAPAAQRREEDGGRLRREGSGEESGRASRRPEPKQHDEPVTPRLPLRAPFPESPLSCTPRVTPRRFPPPLPPLPPSRPAFRSTFAAARTPLCADCAAEPVAPWRPKRTSGTGSG